eukprot:CAMPEP_0194328378 /NCGR_PEP_ID=MMETSP0171-20130528/44525_1 /TAXON_ID=218684 /ORGANISM="Corethron pennatum, Strain L29A3" /LENGTH=112 /DNA_ID=CAMNT_0039088691 /DNA_START=490 /DNA_END=828 /DNA_ORIENTATION=-
MVHPDAKPSMKFSLASGGQASAKLTHTPSVPQRPTDMEIRWTERLSTQAPPWAPGTFWISLLERYVSPGGQRFASRTQLFQFPHAPACTDLRLMLLLCFVDGPSSLKFKGFE